MPGDPQSSDQHRVGEHWGPGNPIPKIQKFVENLDVEKKERNRQIDKEIKERRKQGLPDDEGGDAGQIKGNDGEAIAHRKRQVSKRKTRVVTDPTTGKDIEVEDQDEESMQAVKDPTVCFSADN